MADNWWCDVSVGEHYTFLGPKVKVTIELCQHFGSETITGVVFNKQLSYAKSRKYRGIFEEHSQEKYDKFGKRIWSQQVEQVPKVSQVSGGVSVPCRHATPVANVVLKPFKIR